MARTFTPRVNRHVTYYRSNGKPVSATIVATGSANGGLILRIGHNETVGDATTGILRGNIASSSTAVLADQAVIPNTWRPA